MKKKYCDSEGTRMTLAEMIKNEPGWARNRIREGEKAIEKLKQGLSAEATGYVALAEKIADRLLSENREGEKGYRLAIKYRQGNEVETEGGVWCRNAIITQIIEELEAT